MIVLSAYIGNIVKEDHAGAIVNAAKMSLEGGGGVDGAVHHAAGFALKTECMALPDINDGTFSHPVRCMTGDAVMTDGFDLLVPYIIHTVGPVYETSGVTNRAAPAHLASCYRECMETALSHGLPEITFPAISTGIYGYPLEDATVVAVNTVLLYAKRNIRVNFVCFDETNFLVYKRVIDAARDNWCVAECFS